MYGDKLLNHCSIFVVHININHMFFNPHAHAHTTHQTTLFYLKSSYRVSKQLNSFAKCEINPDSFSKKNRKENGISLFS